MFSIQQSTFLHALGYAIGHSLWQTSAIWLAWLGITQIRSWKSSHRYVFAVAAALGSLLSFLITFTYFVASLNQSSEAALATEPWVVAQGMENVNTGNGLLFIYRSVWLSMQSLAPYLSCAYLAVMMMLCLRLVNGFKQVGLLRNEGLAKAPVDWRLFVRDKAALLGIKRPVRVFVSKFASSPLTLGFWKPIILIPIASFNHLSPKQVEAILLHELAHIRRYDYLLNLFLQAAEIALFFNPFVRVFLKQAKLERENSCDDWVLQFNYEAADYARALLSIQTCHNPNLLPMGAASNTKDGELLVRIRRMVAPQKQPFNYRQQLALLMVLTLLGLGFTAVQPKKNKVENTAMESALTDTALLVNTLWESPAPQPAQPAAVDWVRQFAGEANNAPAAPDCEVPPVDKPTQAAPPLNNNATTFSAQASGAGAVMKGIADLEEEAASLQHELTQIEGKKALITQLPSNISLAIPKDIGERLLPEIAMALADKGIAALLHKAPHLLNEGLIAELVHRKQGEASIILGDVLVQQLSKAERRVADSMQGLVIQARQSGARIRPALPIRRIDSAKTITVVTNAGNATARQQAQSAGNRYMIVQDATAAVPKPSLAGKAALAELDASISYTPPAPPATARRRVNGTAARQEKPAPDQGEHIIEVLQQLGNVQVQLQQVLQAEDVSREMNRELDAARKEMERGLQELERLRIKTKVAASARTESRASIVLEITGH